MNPGRVGHTWLRSAQGGADRTGTQMPAAPRALSEASHVMVATSHKTETMAICLCVPGQHDCMLQGLKVVLCPSLSSTPCHILLRGFIPRVDSAQGHTMTL